MSSKAIGTLAVFFAIVATLVTHVDAQTPAIQIAAPAIQIAAPAIQNYRLGPNDVVTVSVWGEENLSGKYVVDADGAFTFPLIGRLQVGGLTLNDVEGLLRTKLADGYLKKPQLTAKVDEFRSRRIFVVGEVRVPNAYALSGAQMNLVEALARAGSTTATAGSEVLVIRPQDGASRTGPVLPGAQPSAEVIRSALKDGAPTQNVTLRDGDTVYVPKAELVYVFGQVRTPGGHPLPQGATVLQALSLAGGLTERGSTSRIKIVRTVDGKRSELKARLEDAVRPGDTVIVAERIF